LHIKEKIQRLWNELHPDKDCPFHDETQLLKALRIYETELSKLEIEHKQLLEKEPEIRREEQELCQELNEKPLKLNDKMLLVTTMSLITTHILELRDEKKLRLKRLEEIVNTLKNYEELNGWKPPTNETMVGRLLREDNVANFSITNEAVELVEKEFNQIQEQIEKAEKNFGESQKKLKKLIPKNRSLKPTNEALLEEQNFRLSKLPDLIAEVDRYTEHEMDKLTGEILKSRTRIYHIIDKLSIGIDDIDVKYPILKQDEFTENLQFMHEELLQELETQYEANKFMYEQIENWHIVFREFQEFEKSASDSQRFYRRGYSALAEEKTRHRLEQQLKDIEMKLKLFYDEFERKNNKQTFKINGIDLMAHIQETKDQYQAAKNREREQRALNKINTPTSSSSTTASTKNTTVGRTPLRQNQRPPMTPTASSSATTSAKNTTVGRTPLKQNLRPPMTPTAPSSTTKSTKNTTVSRTPLKHNLRRPMK